MLHLPASAMSDGFFLTRLLNDISVSGSRCSLPNHQLQCFAIAPDFAMKLLIDFFPVVLFLIAYKLTNIYTATMVIILSLIHI